MSTTAPPAFETRNLRKWYPFREESFLRNLIGDTKYLKAVDDVSITIRRGEIMGLAGQSGCGKSTLGELLALLREPTSGTILFDGEDVTDSGRAGLKEFRRRCQVIFQDPYESLNPRFTVGRTIIEPLKIHKIGTGDDRRELAIQALEDAGLVPAESFFDRYPSELSGGQRQRVSIARALVMEPEVIIADEPASMLDVSVSTALLDLFKTLQREKEFTMLYISHDLGSINYLTDRTMIMYLGDVVEVGPTEEVIANPLHPYTEALLRAVPNPDPDQDLPKRAGQHDVPDPVDLPSGCRYRDRCGYETEECAQAEPRLKPVHGDHDVACYHPLVEES